MPQSIYPGLLLETEGAAAEEEYDANKEEDDGEQAGPTCVVECRPSVDSGGPRGLDEPLGAHPSLSGPAAEGREVKVAGEPDVRWDTEERADGGEFEASPGL